LKEEIKTSLKRKSLQNRLAQGMNSVKGKENPKL
jgi:hypothetical protein